MEFTPAIAAVALFLFAMVSRRVARSPITGTMLFTALGLVLGPEMLDLVNVSGLVGRHELISLVLTATLVVVLFTDASAINSSNWREDVIPARLLGIGLPLTIALGWIVATVLLGDLELWEAALLGTMLAPTDAALGKAVVSNPRVPQRIRQALNIESGLNDGISLPVFVVFLEAAKVAEDSLPVSDLLGELVQQVGVAVAVGVFAGRVGALALSWAGRAGSAVGYWLQIGVVIIAVAAYAIADPLGGSGFIAAWVAGYMFGRAYEAPTGRSDEGGGHDIAEFAETSGDLLTIVSFGLFGVYLGPALTDVTWQVVVYAVLSLAVIRVVSVGAALIGSGMKTASVVYLGWFGPRGLATIILTLEVVDESGLDGASVIATTALVTVALSVVAHGATAWWGSNAYADWAETHSAAGSMPEDRRSPHVPIPLRSRN